MTLTPTIGRVQFIDLKVPGKVRIVSQHSISHVFGLFYDIDFNEQYQTSLNIWQSLFTSRRKREGSELANSISSVLCRRPKLVIRLRKILGWFFCSLY